MEKVARRGAIGPFNGLLETGTRAVVLLHASYPKSFDLQRLTALDYFVVKTGSLGGPVDLHPKAPLKSPVTQVRRSIVLRSLNIMMSHRLVAHKASKTGIVFQAGQSASLFCSSFQSSYLGQLKERAEWLDQQFGELSDTEFDNMTKQLLNDWIAEFQDDELPSGEAK
jgi:hypothetical protein